MATLFSNSMARPSYVKFDSDQGSTFRAAAICGLGARPKTRGPVTPASALAAEFGKPDDVNKLLPRAMATGPFASVAVTVERNAG